MDKLKIGNNDLYIFPTDKFKSELLNIYFAFPADKRLSPLNTLLFNVFTRATADYPTIEALNSRFEELYGTIMTIRNSLVGDTHLTGFSLDMLGGEFLPEECEKQVFEGALDVIASILFSPLTDSEGYFLDSIVNCEKINTCNDIRSQINSPKSYAAKRMRELMYEGKTYGISVIGDVDTVMSFTKEELKNRLREVAYELPMTVMYVGQRDPEYVKMVIEDRFSRRNMNKTFRLLSDHIADTVKVRRFEDSMPVSQSRLEMGLKCGVSMEDGIDAYCTMMTFNEMFGGGYTSKLFMRVRETLGLCYGVYSQYISHKGLIRVSCGIKRDNRDTAEKEIMGCLEMIRSGDFTDEELNTAKEAMINSLKGVHDSPQAICALYLTGCLYNVDMSVKDVIEGMKRVTREGVIESAIKTKLDTVYFLEGTKEKSDIASEDEEL